MRDLSHVAALRADALRSLVAVRLGVDLQPRVARWFVERVKIGEALARLMRRRWLVQRAPVLSALLVPWHRRRQGANVS